MSLGIYKVPVPKNEPVRDYAPGSPERASLQKKLAGIHFTGSTGVFNGMWRTVEQNLEKYRSYPRLRPVEPLGEDQGRARCRGRGDEDGRPARL